MKANLIRVCFVTGAMITMLCSNVLAQQNKVENVSNIVKEVNIQPYSDKPMDLEVKVLTPVVNKFESGKKLYSTASLNIRSEASAESKYLGTLSEGESFILDEDLGNGWLKFTYKDSSAYVSADYVSEDAPMIKVSSTAYWDEYNRTSASGRELKQGHSVAGRVCWLGKTIKVYERNEDGSVGKLRGTYKFDDTGYGAESGKGQSKILEGKTIGTIENGTCIDFYFNNADDCVNYGRQDIYIQFVD